jgi:ATP-binding cassette subfamily B protein
VGPTGAGKTSIMSLLLRFYPYQKGSIEINGKPIEAYSVQSLRKQFGVVLQDPVIFSATLEENISFDDPSIDVDSVVRQLGITHLPRDLRGKRSELSVGEMQLVAMARALAHHRGFFMLDEATANIDSATERVIQEALKVLIHESTSLVIAYRLSTIKDVKRILVLSRGSLVEEGSHEELIAQNGLYEKLYRLQFLD